MMDSDMKEVVSLAVELCSEPTIYDATIARDLIDLLMELNDFDMSEHENLRSAVRTFWKMDEQTSKEWTTDEIMNLALLSTNDSDVKKALLSFIQIDRKEE